MWGTFSEMEMRATSLSGGLLQKALLLRRGEQQAVAGAAGETPADLGEESVRAVEQGARQQARHGGKTCVRASHVGGSAGHGIELDEGAAILDPQQGLDALQVILLAQGAAQRGVAGNEQQVGAALVGEDELHRAMAEGAFSVKDEHGGRGHGC